MTHVQSTSDIGWRHGQHVGLLGVALFGLFGIRCEAACIFPPFINARFEGGGIVGSHDSLGLIFFVVFGIGEWFGGGGGSECCGFFFFGCGGEQFGGEGCRHCFGTSHECAGGRGKEGSGGGSSTTCGSVCKKGSDTMTGHGSRRSQ